MRPCNRTLLMLQVIWELFRYDLLSGIFGFQGIHTRLRRTVSDGRPRRADAEFAVSRAVACISSFYWKPLPCLQRSVVTARLLRKYGIKAEVVIGYRAVPFLSHAWVEVNGRVVNDSQAYPQKLSVLERF